MNCVPMTDPANDLTEDGFLGGRLRLRQPVKGHRAGHDAMLLAAATSVRAGQRVVDFGAGVGAAGLAVAQRDPVIDLVMVEIDPAKLAAHHLGVGDLVQTLKAANVAADAGSEIGVVGLGGQADIGQRNGFRRSGRVNSPGDRATNITVLQSFYDGGGPRASFRH